MNNVNNVFIIYNISPIVNSVKNVCYIIFSPLVNSVQVYTLYALRLAIVPRVKVDTNGVFDRILIGFFAILSTRFGTLFLIVCSTFLFF